MGLFKKNVDPFSQRAKALDDQIAALETQIKQLSAEQAQAPVRPEPPASPQPRLRSTAVPHGQKLAPAPAPESPAPARAQEPVFEQVDEARLQAQQQQATAENSGELGVRQNDFATVWRRLKSHFQGPATTNPKLVNYLAAGSIQGLRPMRYEKRVARNRFIFLVVFLALALWGIVAILLSRR